MGAAGPPCRASACMVHVGWRGCRRPASCMRRQNRGASVAPAKLRTPAQETMAAHNQRIESCWLMGRHHNDKTWLLYWIVPCRR